MDTEKIKNYIYNKFNKKQKFIINEIKGDASKRKYYRAKSENTKYIIMDSSLEKRNFQNFLKFTKIYSNNKIFVPKIFNINNKKKILIMEDLGKNLLFDKVNETNEKIIYEKAVINILNIQNVNSKNIYKYTKEHYFRESYLFIDWVLKRFMNIKISKKDKNNLSKSLNIMINNINHKSNKLVHRDYHSKNIFYKNKKIIIIDYQDGLYGSPLYDFVSLINDCYRDLKKTQRNKLIKIFSKGLNENNISNFSMDEFLHNFHLVTAQRHLKAAGIFCRLSVRNNRHNYLPHLNRTLNYIVNATSYYDNLSIINSYANEALKFLNESNHSRGR
tara:strand:+ start:80 stop:1072 length:993 start_codon:yes stop_codon:yes gene_type:complete